jgi:hypothetical protein
MHILADNLCKDARNCRKQTKYHSFPANTVNLAVKNQTINANVPNATTIAYHSMALRDYLQGKHGWLNQEVEKIWWKVHQKSIGKMNINNQPKIIKFIHNYMPTNQKSHQY